MNSPPTRKPRTQEAFDPTAAHNARLYKVLLDSIPSSMLLLDAHLCVVSANQNFLVKARAPEAQVIGQRLEAVFPSAIYQHMNLRQRVADVFHTGEALKGERMLYRAPGLPARTYYYSLIPFRGDNSVEHVMLLMEDVTDMIRLSEEARRVERHLASVVESASDIVLSMDTRGRILTWNTAATRISGFEESDVRHRNLGELCRDTQRAALARALENVPHQRHTDPLEVELCSRAGQLLPISWVFSAMRDEEARVVGLVAVGRDLTERRKFEAQLLQSEKLAALGVMASGIAHEVRNPLAVVSSAAQMLLHKSLTPAIQAECAERIHGSAQRMASIIESLLRFARPADQGRMKRLDLTPIVREALDLVASQAKLAQVEMVIELPPVPILVQGNAGLLQQLVMNVLLNAINAMPQTGGKIQLWPTPGDSRALLRIADTGCGIAAADLPKVFDPFFTAMPVGKGTGLGLSICYAIVQRHGGQIEIVSQEGIGTTVTVSLPQER